MGDEAGDADFPVESLEQTLIARGLFGEELECYGLTEGKVGGAVDFAHAASPQKLDDAVAAAEQGAGKKTALVFRGAGGTDV
jgi:hypothetical protein